jgi:hypothetical protein
LKLNQIQWHINMLTHQEICANSNTTCPPQRSMQQIGIETILGTPRQLTILNYFLFSFTLTTPWQLAQWDCILFHSTTYLHAKYSICIICTVPPSCILYSSIPCLQPWNLYTLMEKRKLSLIIILNTLKSMIEYTLISSILQRICEMTK